MEVTFKHEHWQRLETDPKATAGFPHEVVKKYRMRMEWIRSARDERDLYARKSYRIEKLKGNREGQYSIRLNDQFRLVLEIHPGNPGNVIHVIEVVDYH